MALPVLAVPGEDVGRELMAGPNPLTGWRVVTGLAILKAESNLNAYAVNLITSEFRADGKPNPAFLSLDLGIAQWNTYWWPAPIAERLNWKLSVAEVRRQYTERFAAATGTYSERVTEAWSLWVAYTSGAHEKHLPWAVDVGRAIGAVT